MERLEMRRQLVRFLLASPLLASADRLGFGGADSGEAIRSVEDALNVLDFEAAARAVLPPAHFGYLATGVDDDATLRANREGFTRYGLRMRRFVDTREIDMSVSFLGESWPTPIVLCPVSSQKAFHEEGEVATARAARSKRHLQILSTVTSTGIEDVANAYGGPLWFQLYPTDQWPITESLVRRVKAAGTTVLVLTIDLKESNRETLARARRLDSRDCAACHQGNALNGLVQIPRKPMFRNLDVSKVGSLLPYDLSWDYVKRVRDLWPGKLVLKGIVTREDADQAAANGADGIVVSNHGGRAEESGLATIDSLSEVVKGAAGRVPVLVDGGFRRGTDIFKALALGATAVCVGRPYIWGLAAFGQSGVEAVLEILRVELARVMRQAGTRRIADIDRSFVVENRR